MTLSLPVKSLCIAAAVLLAACVEPRPDAPMVPDAPAVNQEMKRLAQDVYVYAYPLVLMDVSKQVMTAKQPINRFLHSRSFPDHTFTDVVSPNADTLYSTAWLDLSQEPIVLSVPPMGKRYYLMPMLDGWTNVFASPGTRTTGNGPGNFAIVGPKWNGTLPKGVKEIRSPTEMVWIIGRTQVNGKADFAAVAKLQDQYKLTPLSAWGKPGAVPATPLKIAVSADVKRSPVEQVAAMDAQTFFSRFASLLPDNPTLPDDGVMIFKMRKLGIVAGKPFDMSKLDPAAAMGVGEGAKEALDGIVAAAKNGDETKSGWIEHLNLGNYRTNYPLRALTAWVGLGANLAEDAVYPMTRVDAAGQPLAGAKKYVLHFDKGQMPPVNAFWSLTMYNEKQFFVANPIGRYAIGDRDRLKFNQDGSLDLYIQNQRPGKDRESNWLPAPKDDFNLIMRLYWPKKPVLDGTWQPPAVRRVG